MPQVITNKDGRMETVNDAPGKVTQADVDRTRRELKDMLAGNTPFHIEKPADPLPEVPNSLTPCHCYGCRLGAGCIVAEVNRDA